jgi:hypothetical protein
VAATLDGKMIELEETELYDSWPGLFEGKNPYG